MAEAHSAVAFSFIVSHEGVDINYDKEILYAVWQSGVRSWRRRITKFWNSILNGAYPASPYSLIFFISFMAFTKVDISFFLFDFIAMLEPYFAGNPVLAQFSIPILYFIYGWMLWLIFVNFVRYAVKILFMYKGWMYESRGGKSISIRTKLWLLLTKLVLWRKPKLYSFQGSLPNLPLPSLNDTMDRYLRSVKALHNLETYNRMERLTLEFKNGIGKKLQRYLLLKSLWSTNYVTDWWEEFIYLRGRSSLMINSNFYGTDAIFMKASTVQAARAANIIHSAMLFRRAIDRQTLFPIMVQGTVPLCSAQYERLFNTTRIPGPDTDKLYHLDDSQHIAVYHSGHYYKVPVYYLGRLLKPCEIQKQIEKILNDNSVPQDGENHLGALTSAERTLWAEARGKYFKKGVNKTSLDAIEEAAFFVSLDEDSYVFDKEEPSKLNSIGCAMLHGKGFDRWFDKSFSIIVGKNGCAGLNTEHSWADAPIIAHLWEFCIAKDINGYKEDGNCPGEPEITPPVPIRLKWDMSPECVDIIEQCVISAKEAISDVDLKLLMHSAYGKGFMKKCKVSPDAYIQMALQLAYFCDVNKFSLTYEASMTRLYREGRTETVRPVTVESCVWVKAMLSPNSTVEEKQMLFREACDRHQSGYQDAMCGKGIDRHLFCLYVVAKYLNVESPFLNEVLGEPWRLSTSQTPHGQTDMIDFRKNPQFISAGGGFGPVADDGYGVSYIIPGEDTLFFHISSKVSSAETDSSRFSRNIVQALQDIKNLFEHN